MLVREAEEKRREQCDHAGRDWSALAVRHRRLAATGSWKMQGTVPGSLQRVLCPADTLLSIQ